MSFKTSYSQNNTYINCPQHWKHAYVDKLESPTRGASTYFGQAVDAAVMEMLRGNADYMKKFYSRWDVSYENSKPVVMFDNPNIIFGHSDFDEDLIGSGDKAKMGAWLTELNLGDPTKDDPIAVYKQAAKAKKNPYKKPTSDQIKYFNRCAWLSMKEKGKILIESFKDQFYPKIKRVIDTQKQARITDPHTGDAIVGYIDMVLEIEGYDKPVIFDLKTAAWPYEQEEIDLSEQLTLYSAMKSNEYNTDLVGYVVLPKAINKDIKAVCQSCGFTRNGTHTTCNNDIPVAPDKMVRCKGAWLESVVLKPKVQILVEKKSPEQVNALLNDISNIVLAMKNKIVYKNTEKCNNWYGSKCPFYNACHNNDFTGLKKKGDKNE